LNQILSLCDPLFIMLFGEKKNVSSPALKSADFLIVIENGDKTSLMRRIYLNVDSEIPFNLLIHTKAEWDELVLDPYSFASQIQKKGVVMYERQTGNQ